MRKGHGRVRSTRDISLYKASVAITRPRGWLLICLAVIGYPIIRKLVAPYGEFDFQGGRYYTHCFPLAVILAAVGVAQMADWAHQQGLNTRRLLPGVAALGLLAYAPSLGAQAKVFGLSVKNTSEMQVHVGQWLASHTPADSLIAANDIAAIAVFADRRILDTVGLTNPEVIPYVHAADARSRDTGYAKEGLLRYLQSKRPDYLVVFPAVCYKHKGLWVYFFLEEIKLLVQLLV